MQTEIPPVTPSMDGAGEPDASLRPGCRCCGQAPVDYTRNPNSHLCGECRQKLIRYPVPRPLLGLMLLVVLLMGVSFAKFPAAMESFAAYRMAEQYAAAADYDSAIQVVAPLLDRYPQSPKVILAALDYCMAGEYYYDAAYVFDEYAVGLEVNDADYKRMDDHYKKLISIFESIDEEVAQS